MSSGLRGRRRRAFSLMELIIVLAVTVVLTGLLLPVLSQVRENVNRVVCASNLRQMGLAFVMYDRDNSNNLPYAHVLRWKDPDPRELMAASLSERRDPETGEAWDGIGLLFSEGYCAAVDCYYCPSHRGEHTFDVYVNAWLHPEERRSIYTNYHYSGDREWEEGGDRRDLDQGIELILATDGFRTLRDINHSGGMNLLRGDGSVRWRDGGDWLASILAKGPDDDTYRGLWRQLNDPENPEKK